MSATRELKDGSAGDSGQDCNLTHTSSDPSMEQKIISKMGALAKRQAFWSGRMDESVPAETLYNPPHSFTVALCIKSISLCGEKCFFFPF